MVERRKSLNQDVIIEVSFMKSLIKFVIRLKTILPLNGPFRTVFKKKLINRLIKNL